MTLDLGMVIPRTSNRSGAQWRIDSLGLVNWGGFHGHHRVRFHPGSTLMSGASGTGKSTVLDAYIALMMTSDTPFNGASNDVRGRARSAEQRNLLTYLRGKMDTSRIDGSTELRDDVLRGGNGEPIWGAIAASFVNDDGRKYTVLRIFFVKAGAKVNADVTTTFATYEGDLDLERLEPLAAQRFDKRVLKATIAGLTTFNTFWEFEESVHARLGIGGGGGGRNAMRLLSRVQAGMQVSRVDSLYKSMVLERPSTYAAADSAIEHFADLEASYAKMVEVSDKAKLLEELPALQKNLAEAEATERDITQLGTDEAGATPFRLWQWGTELRLLDKAVDKNRREASEVSEVFEAAQAEEKTHRTRLNEIADQKRAHGGDAIERLRREIIELGDRKESATRASEKFIERTRAIGLSVPQDAHEFAEARKEAAEFLEGYVSRKASHEAERDRIWQEQGPLQALRTELEGELRSVRSRKSSMVPRALHEARVKMAEAAGLDPMEDLPFVAELIDVKPEEHEWRRAVETTLGGVARTVLVDRMNLRKLSTSIDSVTIRPRINFQAVTLADHEEWWGDPDYVSGKLEFKESPFSTWVQDRVQDPKHDHLCVAGPRELDGPGPRVTRSGQTRHGDRGAHGVSGEGDIIGFSNERRIESLEQQLTLLIPKIDDIQSRMDQIRREIDLLEQQKAAHTYVQDTEWDSIDHLGISRAIDSAEADIERLLAANSILEELQKEETQIQELFDEAMRQHILSENNLAQLEKAHARLTERLEKVSAHIDQSDTAQSVVLTSEQRAFLDGVLRSNWPNVAHDNLATTIEALKKRLQELLADSRRKVKNATTSMERMFESYKFRWTEHNLGTSVQSADGYREILDRILAEGLHERRDRWRREVAAWSSDDLLRLNDTFDTALEEIEDRLEPVNRILKELPFGGMGFLQINMRRHSSEEFRNFRQGLRKLSSGIAADMTDTQVENRFKSLSDFMKKIRLPEGSGKTSTSERDRYLDVRQHVIITAVCIDENDQELATYDWLGGKSGGETQELVAFIVGSALRYQLGDETRSRPRFAPVFLDEGFVKSDSEFAGRAVKAWQNLGFQLIIGAPLDKVTALEPHMDLLLGVTKNARGYSYVGDLVPVDGERVE